MNKLYPKINVLLLIAMSIGFTVSGLTHAADMDHEIDEYVWTEEDHAVDEHNGHEHHDEHDDHKNHDGHEDHETHDHSGDGETHEDHAH